MPENSFLAALNALAPVLPPKLFDQAAHVLLQALLPLPAPAPELAKRTASPASPSRARGRKRAATARRRPARSNGQAAASDRASASRGDRVGVAMNFLKETLAKGPTPAPAIEQAAAKSKISRNALAWAKRQLNVTVAASNGAGPATWSLPA
jgi:hypothetical protein